jgi:hypothetical protein
LHRQLGAKSLQKSLQVSSASPVCCSFGRYGPLGKAQSHLQGGPPTRYLRTCTLNVQQNSSIVNLALLLFILVFLQPLIAILLPERLVIRLLPDSVPPIIKMLSSWGQALSLAILTLNVTCIVAINLGSIEGEASRLIGDLQGDFENFEQAVESELSKALVNSDGVLAQFSMGHQTYATRPIAPTMETSLTVNTEHHLSALDL